MHSEYKSIKKYLKFQTHPTWIYIYKLFRNVIPFKFKLLWNQFEELHFDTRRGKVNMWISQCSEFLFSTSSRIRECICSKCISDGVWWIELFRMIKCFFLLLNEMWFCLNRIVESIRWKVFWKNCKVDWLRLSESNRFHFYTKIKVLTYDSELISFYKFTTIYILKMHLNIVLKNILLIQFYKIRKLQLFFDDNTSSLLLTFRLVHFSIV